MGPDQFLGVLLGERSRYLDVRNRLVAAYRSHYDEMTPFQRDVIMDCIVEHSHTLGVMDQQIRWYQRDIK